MRHLFREHIAETVSAARQGAGQIDLASEAIRMARIATAVHLSESARLMSRPLTETTPEVKR